MSNFKHNYIYGIIGGLLLYILEFFCSSLPYTGIAEIGYDVLLFLCVLSGTITMIVVMHYKNPSFSQSALRFLILLITYICILLLNGYIGTRQIIYKLLGVFSISINENISGMLSITFISSTTMISAIITIGIYLIRRFVWKSHKDD